MEFRLPPCFKNRKKMIDRTRLMLPTVMLSAQIYVTAVRQIQAVRFVDFGSSTVLIYDYFLTLDREVSLIWAAPWTHIKIFYLLTRYTPLVDLSIRIWHNVMRDPDADLCFQMINSAIYMLLIGTCFSEVLLTLRTWAVWQRDRRIGFGLLIFFGLCWCGQIPLFIIFVNSLSIIPHNMPGIPACMIIGGNHLGIYVWLMVLVYEAGICLLMAIKGIQWCNYMQSVKAVDTSYGATSLFTVVFQEGLLYYLALFACSLTNMIIGVAGPTVFFAAILIFERVVHSIIACRVILDIRNEMRNPIRNWLGIVPGSIDPQTAQTQGVITSSPRLGLGEG